MENRFVDFLQEARSLYKDTQVRLTFANFKFVEGKDTPEGEPQFNVTMKREAFKVMMEQLNNLLDAYNKQEAEQPNADVGAPQEVPVNVTVFVPKKSRRKKETTMQQELPEGSDNAAN